MKPILMVSALAITFLAGMAAAPSQRHYINLTGASAHPGLPFSDAVALDGTLYVAGRIGIDPATGKPPADIDQEIKLLLDGFAEVLKQGGMTMDDLVSVQVFCPDLSLYDLFNAAYRLRFHGEPPARAFVGSGPLLRGGHFEMMGTAIKR